jgi:hypothetical protein
MKTNYEKQATDFLEKTGCTMEIKFKENRRYFPDDKEARDVYDIQITRGNRMWVFEFGNSIADSEFVAVYGRSRYKIPSGIRTRTLDEIKRYVRMNLQSDFGTSRADKIIMPKPPTSYDVLACLTKYDVGTLEDFCYEFGYDSDSKTADRVYAAVKEEWLNVCRIWNDSEIEELAEIQ